MQNLYGYIGISVAGTTLSTAELALLTHPAVGAVVLFTRNIETPKQREALIAGIRACRKDMIIMVDCEGMDEQAPTRTGIWRPMLEGGQVNKQFLPPPPSQFTIAKAYEQNQNEGLAMAYQAGAQISALWTPYRVLSLSVVLCSNPGDKDPYENPVTQNRQTVTGNTPGALFEIGTETSSTQDPQLSQELSTEPGVEDPKVGWVIRGLGRSFGESVETIYNLAKQKLLGTKESGGITHVKHVIDHGWAGEDSHVGASIDSRSKEDLLKHLGVYKRLAEDGVVDTVMTSHVRFPALGDGEAEFGLSAVGLALLREAVGERPVFLSDCLSMGAIAESTILKASTLKQERCPGLSSEHFTQVQGLIEAISCASNPAKYQGTTESVDSSYTDIVLACNLDTAVVQSIVDNMAFVPDQSVLNRVKALQSWSEEAALHAQNTMTVG
jgi:hypothetical protein